MRNISIVALAAIAAAASITGSSAAPTQVVEGEEHCVVNVASWDRLNVREEPSSGSAIVTKHRYGDCGITVTGNMHNGWVPVEDGHFAGWVKAKYLSMVSPALYCVTGVPVGDTLNLRAYPSTSSKVIAELDRHQCDIAFLPYAVGSWQKIRVDGYEGWANRKYLSGE
jgi:SH3-like domain-containing protein